MKRRTIRHSTQSINTYHPKIDTTRQSFRNLHTIIDMKNSIEVQKSHASSLKARLSGTSHDLIKSKLELDNLKKFNKIGVEFKRTRYSIPEISPLNADVDNFFSSFDSKTQVLMKEREGSIISKYDSRLQRIRNRLTQETLTPTTNL